MTLEWVLIRTLSVRKQDFVTSDWKYVLYITQHIFGKKDV